MNRARRVPGAARRRIGGLFAGGLLACGATTPAQEAPVPQVFPPLVAAECPGGTTRSGGPDGEDAVTDAPSERDRKGVSCTGNGFVALLAAPAQTSDAGVDPEQPLALPKDWESRAPYCARVHEWSARRYCATAPTTLGDCQHPNVPTPCSIRATTAWERVAPLLPLRLRTPDGLRLAEANCELETRALTRWCEQ